MPIPADDKKVIRAALARSAGARADGRAIAAAAHARWRAIASHLEPVLGESGVHALYRRCLHLRKITTPQAQAPAPTTPVEATGFMALWQDLQARQAADALDCAVAFFDCFGTLLSSLIGAPLTARLLNPVWADGRTDTPDPEPQK